MDNDRCIRCDGEFDVEYGRDYEYPEYCKFCADTIFRSMSMEEHLEDWGYL